MAERSSLPPPRAELTPAQKRVAIHRLEKRVAEIASLDISSVNDRDDPRITGLQASIERTIADVFGPGTHEYRHLDVTSRLDTAKHRMGRGTSIQEVRDGLVRGCRQARALLQQAADSLVWELKYSEDTRGPMSEVETPHLALRPQLGPEAAGDQPRDKISTLPQGKGR